MNRRRHPVRRAGGRWRSALGPLLLSLPLLCAGIAPAGATTPAEDELDKALMPHASLGARGAMVRVHLVSARGFLQGRPDNAAGLARLHADVDACLAGNRARGVVSRPPAAWPAYLVSERLDTYAAANRTIVYKSGLAYAVDQRDCSLLETRDSGASLSSRLGICDIDLRARTARGVCDATGHAKAGVPARQPAPDAAQIAVIERAAATNPAMAALVAAMRAHGGASGERKTIAGVDCEVWPDPFNADGKTCLSLGGSFAAPDSGGDGDAARSGMLLEMTSDAGVQLRATQARLDAMVGDAVFTPYLAGGFHITGTAPRR